MSLFQFALFLRLSLYWTEQMLLPMMQFNSWNVLETRNCYLWLFFMHNPKVWVKLSLNTPCRHRCSKKRGTWHFPSIILLAGTSPVSLGVTQRHTSLTYVIQGWKTQQRSRRLHKGTGRTDTMDSDDTPFDRLNQELKSRQLQGFQRNGSSSAESARNLPPTVCWQGRHECFLGSPGTSGPLVCPHVCWDPF